jgi:osmoprotectant transport system permease protein
MTTPTTEPDAAELSAVPGATGIVRPKSERIVSLRDLITPAVVAAALLALYAYVSGKDLDAIESNILNVASVRGALIEHIYLSVTIALLVLVIAVPLGVVVTRPRTRRLAPLIVGVANIGQAAPSLGLLALVGIYFIGFWAVVLILTAYSALSVLRNTIVGLQHVDRGVLDAARGMGMSPVAILFKVELPLAVPIIGAGARTALVLAVGTVPLGYALNAGGLGSLLFGAIKLNRPLVTGTIAVLIAVLALLMDWAAGIAQRVVTPKGIR